jgi:hypothetical protein
MERLNYTPTELREAFRYLREQAGHLANTHAGNFRTKYIQFVDAVTKNQEALRLFVRILDGHQTADAVAWYKSAADRKAPPLPADRYERLAIVWKLVALAVKGSNPDGFDKGAKVDLKYVMVNSDLPGGGVGEKYESFRQAYLIPFAEELDRFATDVEAALPEDDKASIDFWDATLAAFEAKPAKKAAKKKKSKES